MADVTFQEFYRECVDSLDERYTLVYVDYRDELSREQVAALVAQDWDTLHESIEEWESDARYDGADYCRRETVKDVAEAMHRAGRIGDVDAYVSEFEDSDEYDELRLAIGDRDDSDVIGDLARQTGRVLMRQILVSEDHAWSYEPVSPAAVLARLTEHAEEGTRFDAEDDAHNLRVIGETLAECSPEFSTLFGMIVYAVDVADLYRMSGDYVDVVNPFLYLGNPFMGDGYCGDEPLRGVVRIKRDELTTDRSAFGYGWEEVAGCYVSAYECDVRDVPREDDDSNGNAA